MMSIFVLVAGCDLFDDQAEIKPGIDVIEGDIDLPASIEVLYKTDKEKVIENYLPSETELTLENGESKKVELSWEAPADYDGIPRERQNEGYIFEASFTVKGDIVKDYVIVNVLDEIGNNYLENLNFSEEQFIAVQKEERLELREEQIVLLADPIELLLKEDIFEESRAILEKMLTKEPVDLTELEAVTKELYAALDAKEFEQDDLVSVELTKLSSKPEKEEGMGKIRAQAYKPVLYYTPKGKERGDIDFYRAGSYNYSVSDRVNSYLRGEDLDFDELGSAAISNVYSGAVGAYTKRFLGGERETAYQQIIIDIPNDGVDLIIEADIRYQSTSVDFIGAASSTSMVHWYLDGGYNREEIDPALSWGWAAGIVMDIASILNPKAGAVNIEQALSAIGVIRSYKEYSEALLDAFPNMERETVIYRKEALDKGRYVFTVGLSSRAVSGGAGYGAALIIGEIPNIRVERRGLDEEKVSFVDDNLENKVRSIIDKPEGDLSIKDVEDINVLNAENLEIQSLEGLQQIKNLEELNLAGNNLKYNLSPLAELNNLQQLNLNENKIIGLKSIINLTELRELSLEGNNISVIPLQDLEKLEMLNLRGNNIEDIEPLVNNEGLTAEDYVNLNYNLLDLSENSEDLEHIKALTDRGVSVKYEDQKAQRSEYNVIVEVLCADSYQGLIGATLKLDDYSGKTRTAEATMSRGIYEFEEVILADNNEFNVEITRENYQARVITLDTDSNPILSTGENAVDLKPEEEDTVEYSLTIEKRGQGTVEPPKGNHLYGSGEAVNLKTTPDEGWEFIEWEGDVENNDLSATTVLMDGDKTVRAVFEKIEVDEGFAGGSGTEEDPYQVETPRQLDNVRYYLDKHFKQVDNIDLSGYDNWDPLWEYIDRADYTLFTGTYNGNGFTISNLTINRPTTQYIGLFGVLGEGSKISNLDLENVIVTGNRYVGGLCGLNYGYLENISVQGNIYGEMVSEGSNYYESRYVGGLVGLNNEGNIIDSNSEGEIMVDGYNGGGLAGKNIDGTIRGSYSAGEVTGDYSLGGLIGFNEEGNIEDCHSSSRVEGLENRSFAGEGGLIGRNIGGNITGCYAEGSVAGMNSSGGLVGLNEGGSISGSHAVGDVTAERFLVGGGLVGINYGFIVDSHAEGAVNRGGGLVGRNNDDGVIETCFAEGNIQNGAGLVVSNYGKIITSHATGSVEGRGGLVSTNYGEIIDSYSTGDVAGEDHVGGLVGRNNEEGMIEDSYATGRVAGEKRIGGFVGFNEEGDIKNCFSVGEVDGKERVGGLVGANAGELTDSYAEGNVSGNLKVGGLVGSGGNISRCYATGNVYGEDKYVGGLVGLSTISITNSYATGDVFGYEHVGGLIGRIEGFMMRINITNSYAIGEVIAESDRREGGLVGTVWHYDMGQVIDSYYDLKKTGQSDKGLGIPKTTEEMRQEDTFVNWDYDIIWGIDEGTSYPYLLWQDKDISTH